MITLFISDVLQKSPPPFLIVSKMRAKSRWTDISEWGSIIQRACHALFCTSWKGIDIFFLLESRPPTDTPNLVRRVSLSLSPTRLWWTSAPCADACYIQFNFDGQSRWIGSRVCCDTLLYHNLFRVLPLNLAVGCLRASLIFFLSRCNTW